MYFHLLRATRAHFSQMAPAETGKLGFISLHNLSRFKPSSHAALQDRGQQPLPFLFKSLMEKLSVTSCTTELMQGVIHPFTGWRGLNLQLLLPRKVSLPPDSETKWMRRTQPLLLTLGPTKTRKKCLSLCLGRVAERWTSGLYSKNFLYFYSV